MTPAEITRQLEGEGCSFTLEAGRLRFRGPTDAVNRWRPTVEKFKYRIVSDLAETLDDHLQIASVQAARFCLWHENRQPDCRCAVKSNRHRDVRLTGCLLWQIKISGGDPARHMAEF